MLRAAHALTDVCTGETCVDDSIGWFQCCHETVSVWMSVYVVLIPAVSSICCCMLSGRAMRLWQSCQLVHDDSAA